MYENLSRYISSQLSTLISHDNHEKLCANNVHVLSYEDLMLTIMYEQMEKGFLIPYKLFPNKRRVEVTSECANGNTVKYVQPEVSVVIEI